MMGKINGNGARVERVVRVCEERICVEGGKWKNEKRVDQEEKKIRRGGLIIRLSERS